ncbi:sumo-activating enzyme subunit [Anaeramoeba flamelloides]|uniref:Sumo-activating enzyme subunit n=1 Tax=Anaeramoeba flamelloides TaxID=1746091 RepID=A0AAV7YUY7_9EUKA|nr:sumo-activating enzyme subunit [Anaeramoeba flamelloides]|eukprot:Anaeramoba_flamelloidesa809034_10.p1 GENE.a809034_10~~a809034_10.p1  ORF type:complete len:307 (-),score=55.61 a809034_10:250-1170(-)
MNNLSEKEASRMDRQIRLYSFEGQKSILNSHVLLIYVTGTNSEVAKNLAIGGLGKMTLIDPFLTSEKSLCCNVLVTREHIGKNRAKASLGFLQEMNPNLELDTADYYDLFNRENENENKSKNSQADFIKQFDIVCICNPTINEVNHLTDLCHLHNKCLMVCGVSGENSFVFIDNCNDTEKTFQKVVNTPWSNLNIRRTNRLFFIIQLFYISCKDRKNPESVQLEENDINQIIDELSQSVQLKKVPVKFSDLLDWQQNWKNENSSTASIIGGIVSQEILNTICQKRKPIENFLFFDNFSGFARIEKI